MKKMKNFWSVFSSVAAVILLLAIAFGIGWLVCRQKIENEPVVEIVEHIDDGFGLTLPNEKEKRVVKLDELQSKLIEIAEIATYYSEYEAHKTQEFSRTWGKDWTIPLSKNIVDVTCKGVIKVGYDVNDIRCTVDNDSQTITVTLPEATVLDNYIVWDSVQYHEKNNILNPIDFQQYLDLFREVETDGLNYAVENDIYGKGADHMRRIITTVFGCFEDFTVVFTDSAAE